MQTIVRLYLAASAIFPGEVEKLAIKYLEHKPSSALLREEKNLTPMSSTKRSFKKVSKQSRCAIGRDAYPLMHENRIPFFLLNNILGGPGMNSRLNLSVREKYGLVYSIDSHYQAYTDTGMFAIYFGTEPKQVKKCMGLIRREMDKLCSKRLSPSELASSKDQLKGQLALSEENNLGLMIMMGRAVLDHDRVPGLDELFDKIDDVSSRNLQQVANEIFEEDKLSYLFMEPLAK